MNVDNWRHVMVECVSRQDHRAEIATRRIPILCDQLLGLLPPREHSFAKTLELLYGEVRAACRGNGGFHQHWWNCAKTTDAFDFLGWRELVCLIRDREEEHLTRTDLRNIMVALRGFLNEEAEVAAQA